MQTPSVGRIVIVKGLTANGNDEHPAIINCVFGAAADSCAPGQYFVCNTTVFLDCEGPRSATSLYVFQNRQEAEDYRERATLKFGDGTRHVPVVAFFQPALLSDRV